MLITYSTSNIKEHRKALYSSIIYTISKHANLIIKKNQQNIIYKISAKQQMRM